MSIQTPIIFFTKLCGNCNCNSKNLTSGIGLYNFGLCTYLHGDDFTWAINVHFNGTYILLWPSSFPSDMSDIVLVSITQHQENMQMVRFKLVPTNQVHHRHLGPVHSSRLLLCMPSLVSFNVNNTMEINGTQLLVMLQS